MILSDSHVIIYMMAACCFSTVLQYLALGHINNAHLAAASLISHSLIRDF